MQRFLASLPTVAKVVDQLITRYGPDEVRNIRQVSSRVYQVALVCGDVVVVTAMDNGMLQINKMDGDA